MCELFNGTSCSTLLYRRKLGVKKPQSKRKYWVRPGRTALWWENLKSGLTLAEEWKENSRITKSSFSKLCDELCPYIQKKTTIMRSPIDTEKQVAITLYYLSDEGRLRKTANAFGVARSTVSVIVR